MVHGVGAHVSATSILCAMQLTVTCVRCVPVSGGGGQAMLCGVGYGSLAHLANDPRVNPRAWQEGNDVDGGAVPVHEDAGAGVKLAAAASSGAAAVVQRQEAAAGAAAAVANTAAAAGAPRAAAGQCAEEANVAVSSRELCMRISCLARVAHGESSLRDLRGSP